MRALGVLVLLLIGLGLGLFSSPASAAPCPHHAHEAAPIAQESNPARDEATPKAEVVASALPALDRAVVSMPDAGFGHVVPEGQPCCHVAVAVAAAPEPAFEPHRTSARMPVARSWLPPWAAPMSGVFRPPAFA